MTGDLASEDGWASSFNSEEVRPILGNPLIMAIVAGIAPEVNTWRRWVSDMCVVDIWVSTYMSEWHVSSRHMSEWVSEWVATLQLHRTIFSDDLLQSLRHFDVSGVWHAVADDGGLQRHHGLVSLERFCHFRVHLWRNTCSEWVSEWERARVRERVSEWEQASESERVSEWGM
jgi:hypothetical protein